MSETQNTKDDMASKLIEQDIEWLREESDPIVFNAWLEIVLLEGFKGYANCTKEELIEELARREPPLDDYNDPDPYAGSEGAGGVQG